jgi:hypothetical protein
MKNDLTTVAWQHDIGCPIKIVLFSISDVVVLDSYVVWEIVLIPT